MVMLKQYSPGTEGPPESVIPERDFTENQAYDVPEGVERDKKSGIATWDENGVTRINFGRPEEKKPKRTKAPELMRQAPSGTALAAAQGRYEDRKSFEQHVFKKIGGDPRQLRTEDELQKFADSEEIKDLFNEAFRGQVAWYDRDRLSPEMARYWNAALTKERANISNRVKETRARMEEDYNFYMGKFDDKAKNISAAKKEDRETERTTGKAERKATEKAKGEVYKLGSGEEHDNSIGGFLEKGKDGKTKVKFINDLDRTRINEQLAKANIPTHGKLITVKVPAKTGGYMGMWQEDITESYDFIVPHLSPDNKKVLADFMQNLDIENKDAGRKLAAELRSAVMSWSPEDQAEMYSILSGRQADPESFKQQSGTPKKDQGTGTIPTEGGKAVSIGPDGAIVSTSNTTGDGYGKRADGTEKGPGFLGEIPAKDGKVMTELSVGIDGKEIPTIVPTLSDDQLKFLAEGGDPREDDGIMEKAISHARKREAEGKSPFLEKGEKQSKSGFSLVGEAQASELNEDGTGPKEAGDQEKSIVPPDKVDYIVKDMAGFPRKGVYKDDQGVGSHFTKLYEVADKKWRDGGKKGLRETVMMDMAIELDLIDRNGDKVAAQLEEYVAEAGKDSVRVAESHARADKKSGGTKIRQAVKDSVTRKPPKISAEKVATIDSWAKLKSHVSSLKDNKGTFKKAWWEARMRDINVAERKIKRGEELGVWRKFVIETILADTMDTYDKETIRALVDGYISEIQGRKKPGNKTANS